ncbi:GNAT family N-acetyltransferase [Sphingomonas sp. M1-B02]|uniref:GNAT family N-acetyltransferase n=1 Tax=Sphingomonas sp. M1-B02 TaxID=3114300 RepID=UPI00223F4370|nr:GNAT family N-acetyltransferase [Sphingomonas sp. S6-11]UZK66859.1 GNAT family N-acetyltransferase [Sphingomonas sp. S6-11]
MIRTARLLLRPIEGRDRAALRAMLSDPELMRDLVRDPTPESAEASIDRHVRFRETHGLGFWVVEQEGAVAGFCGLKPGAEGTPIDGEIEIGWIFGHAYWGQGLAREAAQASLDWAWAETRAPRVVAITAAEHIKSQQLMLRLGMQRLADGDFDHPKFAADDPMRRTVTFAIDRPAR